MQVTLCSLHSSFCLVPLLCHVSKLCLHLTPAAGHTILLVARHTHAGINTLSLGTMHTAYDMIVLPCGVRLVGK